MSMRLRILFAGVFGLLLQAALNGSTDGLTAGPPCRTMSVLPRKEDGGPRQVRDKHGPGRFGREGITPSEKAMVDDDTVLFLRTFLLMAVMHAVARVMGKPRPLFFVEQLATPSDYAPDSPLHSECPSLWVWPEAEQIWALVGSWKGGPVFRRPFFWVPFFFWRPSVLAKEGRKERKKRGDAYVERAGPHAPKGVLGCNTLKP